MSYYMSFRLIEQTLFWPKSTRWAILHIDGKIVIIDLQMSFHHLSADLDQEAALDLGLEISLERGVHHVKNQHPSEIC